LSGSSTRTPDVVDEDSVDGDDDDEADDDMLDLFGTRDRGVERGRGLGLGWAGLFDGEGDDGEAEESSDGEDEQEEEDEEDEEDEEHDILLLGHR
jgi:tyrosyl-DNA phosphodiesterase 2